MQPIAVYVHTPFCPSKCGYCDFNSYALEGEIVERTVRATVAEIERSFWAGRPAKTVFFGGGTPTFLSAAQLESLLAAVLRAHPPLAGAEVTSEANPGTVDIPKFKDMRRMGFGRVSLGAQSFDTGDLVRLGRVHEPGHVGRAVQAARDAGFANLNVDLMFALPGQSLRAWETNLRLALALEPEHLSLYCLTVEPNTRYYRYALRGMLDLPDEGAQLAMYDRAVEACAEAGFGQYEVSNFARPGFECRHNLCYWRGEEYAGYGPGAVARVGRARTTNLKHPARYCEAVEAGLAHSCEVETLDDGTLRTERVMLGIRLNEGLPLDGISLDPAGLAECERAGWLRVVGGRAVLTPTGRHLLNEVAVRLL